jgi:hypothetical protein
MIKHSFHDFIYLLLISFLCYSYISSFEHPNLFRLNESIIPPSMSGRPAPPGIKIAYCLTGQLARLELLSKIRNIIIPNVQHNNSAHLFVYLDNEVDNVKQTYWTYNYSNHIYSKYNKKQLISYIENALSSYGIDAKNSKDMINVHVKLAPPSRNEYHVVNDRVPVKAKAFSGHDGPRSNFESAESRFQNNMRWMSGLRDCVRYMQQIEFYQQWHYDIVVRLRDDSYALGPWIIDQDYIGKISSLKTGSFRGINDHNLAVDRKYADILLRGLTEDYYFNSSLESEFWGNAEHRISMMVDAYNIPHRVTTICEQPLIPLRGLENETYWRIHPLYVRHFSEDCGKINTEFPGKYPNCCTDAWMQAFRLKYISL